MLYKIRKKAQKMLNKRVDILNKAIEKDELWQGRFSVRQRAADWVQFSDGSGGELFASLRFYDKKTGYYHDWPVSALYPNGGKFVDCHLAVAMNEFIVNYCDVWSETPSPREESFKRDYTNVNIPDIVMKRPANYYLNKEAFFNEENIRNFGLTWRV